MVVQFTITASTTTMNHEQSKLFQPVHHGASKLSHRIVLAPLTRCRASDAHVPTEMMLEHYVQRACVPGTLLLTEGTVISPRAGGMDNVPGIWNAEQIEAWKRIVDAVHGQGSFIFCQLWHMGRCAYPKVLERPDCPSNPGGPHAYVGSSAIMNAHMQTWYPDLPIPRELSHEEILETIRDFREAAANAVLKAGFDGVEIQGAHGYLVDSFLQDTSNQRSDMWGGSIENRCRFALDVIKAVVDTVGEERTALRISPFSTQQGMHMKHPHPTFAFLVTRIRELYPRFAHLHVLEPRMTGSNLRTPLEWESNDFLRALWKSPDAEESGSVYISTGGYEPASAIEDADRTGDLIGFGRHFLANPDLAAIIRKGMPLNAYDRKLFYTAFEPAGYVDYPFAVSEAKDHFEKWKARSTLDMSSAD